MNSSVLKQDKNVPMQIRIPDAKKKIIKADAAMRGISVSQLLVDAYDNYQNSEKLKNKK